MAEKGKRKIDRYYDLLEQMRAATGDDKHWAVLRLCEESLPFIPAIAREVEKEGIALVVPAIETGLLYWSILGDLDKIRRIESLIEAHPDLGYEDLLEEAYSRVDFATSILQYITGNPGSLQKDLAVNIGLSKETVSHILYYLAKFGRIRREKAGSTYKLYIS